LSNNKFINGQDYTNLVEQLCSSLSIILLLNVNLITNTDKQTSITYFSSMYQSLFRWNTTFT